MLHNPNLDTQLDHIKARSLSRAKTLLDLLCQTFPEPFNFSALKEISSQLGDLSAWTRSGLSFDAWLDGIQQSVWGIILSEVKGPLPEMQTAFAKHGATYAETHWAQWKDKVSPSEAALLVFSLPTSPISPTWDQPNLELESRPNYSLFILRSCPCCMKESSYACELFHSWRKGALEVLSPKMKYQSLSVEKGAPSACRVLFQLV